MKTGTNFCQSCGGKLKIGANFCVKCGSSAVPDNNVVLVDDAESTFMSRLFGGRIGVGDYWLAQISSLLIILIGSVGEGITNESGIVAVVVMILYFVYQISFSIKRAHDLGYGGAVILLGIVPVLNLIVAIYFGFVNGSNGPNIYGVEPQRDKDFVARLKRIYSIKSD